MVWNQLFISRCNHTSASVSGCGRGECTLNLLKSKKTQKRKSAAQAIPGSRFAQPPCVVAGPGETILPPRRPCLLNTRRRNLLRKFSI
jgi:hypothetical protein